MRFAKWHGLGNAYLLVERPELGRALSPAAVRRLCDTGTGVGADGVLEVTAVDGARAEVAIWNPDGSSAELSGNGTRIAARWLARRARAAEVVVAVGAREVTARLRGGELVETDLGAVEVLPRERLVLAGGEEVEVVPVSVGNPHAVVRTEPTGDALRRLGPEIEGHLRFPARTNVQLVRVEAGGDLTVAVWERGVGETRSSGTSACAAAAAAVSLGWSRSPVTVHLPGGDLLVELAGGRALLTGPAQEICRGELSAELLAELD